MQLELNNLIILSGKPLYPLPLERDPTVSVCRISISGRCDLTLRIVISLINILGTNVDKKGPSVFIYSLLPLDNDYLFEFRCVLINSWVQH